MITELSGESNRGGCNKEHPHAQITLQCISKMIKVLPYPLAYTQFYIQEREMVKDPRTL